MSGRKLAGALVAIVVLTFVLPPLAARQVNGRRVERAEQAVRRIAEALSGERRLALAELVASAGGGPVVLTGSGTSPKFAPGVGWPEGRTLPLSGLSGDGTFDVGADPWGNCYLAAVGADPGAPVAVLSAGPDGTVDTPFAAALSALGRAPRGGDIVAGR